MLSGVCHLNKHLCKVFDYARSPYLFYTFSFVFIDNIQYGAREIAIEMLFSILILQMGQSDPLLFVIFLTYVWKQIFGSRCLTRCRVLLNKPPHINK